MKFFVRLSAAALLLIAGLAATAYTMRDQLLAPLLRPRIERELTKLIETPVTITGPLSGDYLTHLTAEQVSTVSADGSVRSNIERLTARYQLRTLIDGIDPFLATLSLELERPTLTSKFLPEFKTTIPQDLVSLADFMAAAPFIPRLEIKNGTLVMDTEYGPMSATGVTATYQPDQAKAGFGARLAAERLTFGQPDAPVATGPFRAEVDLAGSSCQVRQLVFGEIALIPEADLDIEGLARAELAGHAKIIHGNSQADAVLEVRDGAASLTATVAGAESSVLAGLLPEESPGLSGVIAGQVRLSLPLDQPRDITAALDLTASRLLFAGRDIEDLAIAAVAKNSLVAISRLDGRLGANHLRFAEVTLPLGAEPWDMLRQGEAKFELDLADLPLFLKAMGKSGPALESSARHRLRTSGRLTKGRVELAAGTFTADQGQLQVEKAGLSLPATPDGFASSAFTLAGRLAFDELAPTARLVTTTAISGGLTADISLAGTVTAPRGAFTADFRNLVVDGRRIGNGRVRGEADSRKIMCRELAITSGKNKLAGHGVIDPAGRLWQDFAITANIADLAGLSASALPEIGRLAGVMDASFTMNGKLDNPAIAGSASFTGVERDGMAIDRLKFSINGDLHRLAIRDLAAHARDLAFTASADLERRPDGAGALSLQALAGKWLDADLALAAPVMLNWRPDGSYEFSSLALSGSHGSLTASAKGRGKNLERLSVAARQLSSGEWSEHFFGNKDFFFRQADLNAEASGEINAPVVRLQGKIGEAGAANQPFSFAGDVDLETSGEGVVLSRFEWQSRNHGRISLSGRVPFDPLNSSPWLDKKLDIRGTAELPDLAQLAPLLPKGAPVAGSLSADFDLAGSWRNPVGHLRLHAEGLPALAEATAMPAGPYSLDCRLTARGDQVELAEFAVKSAKLSFAASGNWKNAPPLPLLLQGGKPELGGELDLAGRLELPDLSFLAEARPEIRRLAGSLKADLAISGPIKSPQATGAITLRDGELRPAVQAPAVHNLAADAHLAGSILKLDSLTGEIGGSPFTVQGEINLAEPSRPECNLALNGKNLLLFRDQELRVRADADLRMIGRLESLLFEGSLLVTDGVYLTRFDLLKMLRGTAQPERRSRLHGLSFRDPLLKNARFNVRLRTDKPFIIRNNLSRGSFRVDLLLAGTGELPYLTGNIFLEPTSLTLPTGRLQLDSGIIRFPENDPDSVTLDLSGTSKMIGYDITALFQGTLDEPVITLSSVPPLPDGDLLMLVLAGIPPKQPEAPVLSKSGVNFAVYLGRDFLARLFPRQEADSEETLIDRFDLIIGRSVTRQGDETIEADFRFAESVLRPGDTLYLTAEKDIFDDFNMGVKVVFRFR